LQIAIDFRFMFPYDDCVHKWLPCSIRIRLLPESNSNPCGRVAGIGLEWNSVPSPKLVQPGCTVISLCNRVAQ